MKDTKLHTIEFLIVLSLVLTGGIFAAVKINQFIGYATYVTGEAGTITELVISFQEESGVWMAFYGLALMVAGYTEQQFELSQPGEPVSKHLVFNCLEPGIDNELYVSYINPSLLNFTNVSPMSPDYIDDLFNLTGLQPAVRTLKHQGDVDFGPTNIPGINLTWSYQYNISNSTYFEVGPLNVSGELVWFTTIRELNTSFNNQQVNYQILLPVKNDTTLYFFTDPFDDCPQGLGVGYFGEGTIYGYVTDLVTNLSIQGVDVRVSTSSNGTDVNGYYNMTASVGSQYLIASYSGYYTYTGLVNLSLGEDFEYNFSMEKIPFTLANGTIQGYVFDNVTNLTLPNATIFIGGKQTDTDANGFYNITVADGNNTIAAILDSYATHVSTVYVPTYNFLNYNITLDPTIGFIMGYAVDNSTGLSLANVNVSIADKIVLTNSTGGYKTNTTKGKHYIVGILSGYDIYASNVTIYATQTIIHNLTMNPEAAPGDSYQTGFMEGYVKDNSTNASLPNVSVSINGYIVLTDSNGFYNATILEGTHNVVATKVGYYNYISNVTIIANNYTNHNFTMNPVLVSGGENGTIQGVVTLEIGSFLENVSVSIAGQIVYTNSTGDYFVDIVAGTHNLVGTKANYENHIASVNITAGSTTYHNFTMNVSQTILTDVGPSDQDSTSAGVGTSTAIEQPAPKKEDAKEGGVKLSINKIIKKLRKGSFLNVPIALYNYEAGPITVKLEIEGEVADISRIDKDIMYIDSEGYEDFTITFIGSKEPGVYEGKLVISGDTEEEIPIALLIYESDKLPIEGLVLDVEILEDRLTMGETLRYRVDIQNLLREETYDVDLKYYAVNEKTQKKYLIGTDAVRLQTSYSLLKSFPLPLEFGQGDYILSAEANYLGLVSTQTVLFKIVAPIFRYSLFGIIPLWWIFLAIISGLFIWLVWWLWKKRQEKKKRYTSDVNTDELPKAGPRSAFVGMIAEANKKTYFDLDKFQIHTLIAGASGSGKTIAAQDLVEEAMMKDVAVIVFDPSAIWTGFLRKLQNKNLLAQYPQFGMKKAQAKSFNGNVHLVEDGRQLIDFDTYMKPGEINIFVTNKLDTIQSETLVANTIKQIFRSNLAEEQELKYLIVYDGIHTLLPKFGGSGKVFVQIERATREFRKWGVGLILLSQVMSDFPSEVLANINTEVLMRTRDEGDLNRSKEEYGEAIVKSLVKAGVGTGMVEMAAYNKGKPYFVTFRPPLHGIERLSEEELENYNKYNNIIDDIDDELRQLKELEMDIFDLNLELNLAKDKVKSGSFNMVDIYLEGLKPRIKAAWDKLGKTPKKRAIKLVDESEFEDEAPSEPKPTEGNGKVKNELPAAEASKIDLEIIATQDLIAKGKNKEGLKKYGTVMVLYKELDKDAKKKYIKKCLELRKKLTDSKPDEEDEEEHKDEQYEKLDDLISEVKKYIENKQKKQASFKFNQVMLEYKELPKNAKSKYSDICMLLRQSIMEL